MRNRQGLPADVAFPISGSSRERRGRVFRGAPPGAGSHGLHVSAPFREIAAKQRQKARVCGYLRHGCGLGVHRVSPTPSSRKTIFVAYPELTSQKGRPSTAASSPWLSTGRASNELTPRICRGHCRDGMPRWSGPSLTLSGAFKAPFFHRVKQDKITGPRVKNVVEPKV